MTLQCLHTTSYVNNRRTIPGAEASVRGVHPDPSWSAGLRSRSKTSENDIVTVIKFGGTAKTVYSKERLRSVQVSYDHLGNRDHGGMVAGRSTVL